MASKRHVVEEGNTPGKPANKRQSENSNTGSRKTLFPGEAKPPALSCSTRMEWSDKEYACLTPDWKVCKLRARDFKNLL